LTGYAYRVESFAANFSSDEKILPKFVKNLLRNKQIRNFGLLPVYVYIYRHDDTWEKIMIESF
jgi:hypothetical protein